MTRYSRLDTIEQQWSRSTVDLLCRTPARRHRTSNWEWNNFTFIYPHACMALQQWWPFPPRIRVFQIQTVCILQVRSWHRYLSVLGTAVSGSSRCPVCAGGIYQKNPDISLLLDLDTVVVVDPETATIPWWTSIMSSKSSAVGLVGRLTALQLPPIPPRLQLLVPLLVQIRISTIVRIAKSVSIRVRTTFWGQQQLYARVEMRLPGSRMPVSNMTAMTVECPATTRQPPVRLYWCRPRNPTIQLLLIHRFVWQLRNHSWFAFCIFLPVWYCKL